MFMTTVSNEQSLPFRCLAMHSLEAAGRLRLSETVQPKWFMFETSKLFVRWANPSLFKIKRELSKTFLLYRINCSCKLFLSMYSFITLTILLSAQRNCVIR